MVLALQDGHCLADGARTAIKEHFSELQVSLPEIMAEFKKEETKEKLMNMLNNANDFLRLISKHVFVIIFDLLQGGLSVGARATLVLCPVQ